MILKVQNVVAPPQKILSSFLIAFGMFFAINFSIVLGCGDTSPAMHLPGTLSQLKEQYRQQAKAPDIALLGSSLMRRPFFAVDQALYGTADYGNYTEARSLADRLSTQSKNISVINAARDGAMISDDLLIEEKLMRGALKPRLIVLGIAPRDFVDCLLKSEKSTDIFKYFFDFYDAIKYGRIFCENRRELYTLLVSQAFPLYSSRQAIQDQVAESCYLNPVATRIKAAQDATGEEEANNLRILELTQKAGNNSAASKCAFALRGKLAALLSQCTHETVDWRMSLWQYGLRYMYIDQNRFKRELNALDCTLKLAHSRQIPVLVVNMPLTENNLNLLPAGFYTGYVNETKEICRRSGVEYLDMQNNKLFSRKCFSDVAHLNLKGGRLFIEKISPHIDRLLKGN